MNIAKAVIITLVFYLGVLYFLRKITKFNSENKVLTIIIYIIIWIFFIGLILSPVLFIDFGKPALGMFGFGAIFAVIGGMVFTLSLDEQNNNMNKFDKKEHLLWTGLMSIIGLIIMLISAIVHTEPDSWQNMFNIVIPLSLLSIFPVIGIVMLYLGIKSIKIPKEFSIEVSATCIELKTNLSTDNDVRRRMRMLYSPVYSYSYNERKYKVCDDIYTVKGNCTKEGENVLIRIDPDNPYLFWDTKRRILSAKYFLLLGIMFTLVGSIGLILFLKSRNIL